MDGWGGGGERCSRSFSLPTACCCPFPAAVFCGYTKCSCDNACPQVNGVSLGYMLSRLTWVMPSSPRGLGARSLCACASAAEQCQLDRSAPHHHLPAPVCRGTTELECDEVTEQCSINVQGLSPTGSQGFTATCQAGECRLPTAA